MIKAENSPKNSEKYPKFSGKTPKNLQGVFSKIFSQGGAILNIPPLHTSGFYLMLLAMSACINSMK